MKYMKLVFAVFMMLLCGSIFAEVNINTATEQELVDGLANIGPAKAAAIISYREKYGSFRNVDEIVGVRGIGMATLEKNRHLMVVGDEQTAHGSDGELPHEAPGGQNPMDSMPEVVREAIQNHQSD